MMEERADAEAAERPSGSKSERPSKEQRLVLTMQTFIPQHGFLLHHIHRDFYSGDTFMVGVVGLWEEGRTTLNIDTGGLFFSGIYLHRR